MKTFAQRLRYAREAADISQSELARRVGIKPQSVQAIEAGGVRGSKYIARFAKELDVSSSWLADGQGAIKLPKSEDLMTMPVPDFGPHPAPTIEAILAEKLPSPDHQDLVPLVTAARAGQDQQMFLDDGPLDYVPRPPILLGVLEAYAMTVTGFSMRPMFRPGQVLHVNPHRQPAPGKGVIVWKRNNSVLVKEFVRRTVDGVVLREYDPEPRDFVVLTKEIKALHSVVGTQES